MMLENSNGNPVCLTPEGKCGVKISLVAVLKPLLNYRTVSYLQTYQKTETAIKKELPHILHMIIAFRKDFLSFCHRNSNYIFTKVCI